jgi:hypothetical protein
VPLFLCHLLRPSCSSCGLFRPRPTQAWFMACLAACLPIHGPGLPRPHSPGLVPRLPRLIPGLSMTVSGPFLRPTLRLSPGLVSGSFSFTLRLAPQAHLLRSFPRPVPGLIPRPGFLPGSFLVSLGLVSRPVPRSILSLFFAACLRLCLFLSLLLSAGLFPGLFPGLVPRPYVYSMGPVYSASGLPGSFQALMAHL